MMWQSSIGPVHECGTWTAPDKNYLIFLIFKAVNSFLNSKYDIKIRHVEQQNSIFLSHRIQNTHAIGPRPQKDQH